MTKTALVCQQAIKKWLNYTRRNTGGISHKRITRCEGVDRIWQKIKCGAEIKWQIRNRSEGC
jgi:hypothetical protein